MSESSEHETTWAETIKRWFAASLVFDVIVAVAIWHSVGTERMAWGFCQVMWVDACDDVFPDKKAP